MQYRWINMSDPTWIPAYRVMRRLGYIWIHGAWHRHPSINREITTVERGDLSFIYQRGYLTDMVMADGDATTCQTPNALRPFDEDGRIWDGYRFDAHFMAISPPRSTVDLPHHLLQQLIEANILADTGKAKGGFPNGKIIRIESQLGQLLRSEISRPQPGAN